MALLCIIYSYPREAWLANGMQDSGLDVREKAEDISQPWLRPRFEKMALLRQEEGRVSRERDSGYLREGLRIQALIAWPPSPSVESTQRLGFSGLCTWALTNPLSVRGNCCWCPARRTRWAKGAAGRVGEEAKGELTFCAPEGVAVT